MDLVLGVIIGAVVGGIVVAIAVARDWEKQYEQLYSVGVIGQLDVVRRIEAGESEELVQSILDSIPQYVTILEREFTHSVARSDALYASKRFFESTKRQVPEDIRGIIAAVPQRAVTCFRLQQLCSREVSCIRLPTSLRPVSDIPFPRGWEKGDSLCGAKKVFWIFRRGCGAPLTIGSCT